MARFLLAIRAFFRILFHAEVAARVAPALTAPEPAAAPEARPAPPAGEPRGAGGRSDALTLLAALQREARFLDLVMEPLSGFSDAQIGAAARDVLRGCAAVLERCFAVQPVRTESEGSSVELPAGFDAGRVRLVGNVGGSPPYRGRLVHPGWQATRCDLPSWSGSREGALVVAPAEVELS